MSVVHWHHGNVSLNYDATRGGIRWVSDWMIVVERRPAIIIWNCVASHWSHSLARQALWIIIPCSRALMLPIMYSPPRNMFMPTPQGILLYLISVRLITFDFYSSPFVCVSMNTHRHWVWATWTRNRVGTNLTEDAANSTLWVARVKPSDSGNYTCSVGPHLFFTTSVHVLNGKSCPFNWTPVTYNWLAAFLSLPLYDWFVYDPFC